MRKRVLEENLTKKVSQKEEFDTKEEVMRNHI
jgi:hypothetical protein